MNDAVPVSLVQRIGDLNQILERLFERDQSALESIVESLPVDVLHHQELRPILGPDVVEGADVRVIQAGDDLGFSPESFATLRSLGQVVRQYLDRHDAVSRVSTAR